MNIPFVDVGRQYKNIDKEIIRVVKDVFSKGRVLQGEKITTLESELARFHNLSYGVAVNSGTDALIFSLRALDLPPKSRVAVTSLSFVASASAIVNAGFIPVFIDVDEYYLMQEKKVLKLIEKNKIKAIVAVHLYGQMMDLKKIHSAAKKKGIKIIEDNAQSLGATRFGKTAGYYSNCVCLSFDPTKVVNAYGSGGMVLTDNKKISEKIKMLRYHGHVGNRIYKISGYNSQMDEVQAAIILEKLRYVDLWEKRRIEIAKYYSNELRGYLEIPRIKEGNKHIFHKYALRVTGKIRKELMDYLLKNGVQTSIHYSLPLNKQLSLKLFALKKPLPVVEKYTKELFSLPIYPELINREVEYVCRKVKTFFSD